MSSTQLVGIDAWFYHYYDDVRGFVAARLTGDGVDDVVSETFVAAWRRSTDVVPGYERAFLLGVARNLLRNARRSQRRRAAVTEALVAARPKVSLELGAGHLLREDAEPIRRAFSELRRSDQELLMLVAWEGLSSGEVAIVLAITPARAADRIHKARCRLRDRLRHYGREP